MKKIVRIGSRESRLAIWQARYVKELIEQTHPDIKAEIVAMKTTGDKIRDRPLEQVGGKGLFVKELDLALMERRTDISVHSLKDMPMDIPRELPILAYSKREDPRDALLLRNGIQELPRIIGTSSRRRGVQLSRLYPSCEFTGIRGNVQTRLRKLQEGYCDGTVLAAAGLKRLGMETRIDRIFEPEEMIPAAGQGILAIQGRTGEEYESLACIMDENSKTAALAERGFVRELDGGCSSPIAAYARVDKGHVCLTGLYYHEAASDYTIGEITGKTQEAEGLGICLARELKERFVKRGSLRGEETAYRYGGTSVFDYNHVFSGTPDAGQSV